VSNAAETDSKVYQAGEAEALHERSGFAARFKETVGATPIDYLTRRRMLLAGADCGGSGRRAGELGDARFPGGDETDETRGNSLGARFRRFCRWPIDDLTRRKGGIACAL
jgi:hypothetical protein